MIRPVISVPDATAPKKLSDLRASAIIMSAMLGRSISHYQIIEKLGEGGMGVVYKARDTRLDRLVAIKILPAGKVSDPERKRRFIQEAKSASSLNHPNIVTIHDIDRSDGIDFIAMEFVQGQRLDQLCGDVGLPLKEALKYAVQIADAFAAAHEAGIVHRDLSTANVMVTDKGVVKILDFGLAKLTEPAPDGERPPFPRRSQVSTDADAIVGTVAFMSPEQAQGKGVDPRSEIFSFGAVLYEMASGQSAFQKDSKAATLAALIHEEPRPLHEVVEGMPRELERIIGLCLRKDPGRRFQHMDDLKVELQALLDELESGSPLVADLPRKARYFPVWLMIVAAGILVSCGALAAWLLRPEPVLKQAAVLTQLTFDSGLTTEPALSADGKFIAFASDRSGEGNLDIWVQHIAGGNPIRLTRDDSDEHDPAFSPDGSRIVFRSEREGGGIWVVPALGGEARMLVPEGRRPRFSPDGSLIAYWTGNQVNYPSPGRSRIFVASASGSSPRQVRPDFAAAAYPVWAPDSRHLLFVGSSDPDLPSEQALDWWVTPLDGGSAVKTGSFDKLRGQGLTVPQEPDCWVPGADQVLLSVGRGPLANLWRIGLSTRTWKAVGPAEQLTLGTARITGSAVSDSRAFAFASINQRSDVWSLPVDATSTKVTGGLQQLTGDATAQSVPSVSLDGRRLLYAAKNSREVLLKDLKTGRETALTMPPTPPYRWLAISPDGSRVAFTVLEEKKHPIYTSTVDPEGRTGVPQKACLDCGIAVSWSHDAKQVLYLTFTPSRISSLDVASGRRSALVEAAESDALYQPFFSPDGRWLAFIVHSLGYSRIHVVPIDRNEPVKREQWIALTDGNTWDDKPRWSPDGNALYFVSDRDGFRCIWAQRLQPETKQPLDAPAAVYHCHSSRLSLTNLLLPAFEISVARDKIVFNMAERTGNIWLAELH